VSTVLIVVAVCWVLLALSCAPAIGRRLRARNVPLPHRPAPGTPPTAGPRHRVEHAHTGSISATEVRRALDAAARTKGRRP